MPSFAKRSAPKGDPLGAGAASVNRTALALSCGLLMDLTDTAALATALPTLAREFHIEPVELKLALTAYLIVAAMLIPISGWLADRVGAKRLFLLALATFTLGSVCCAAAGDLSGLVLARILQGLGGGLMTPVGRFLLVRATPRHELVRALNWFTVPAILGPLLGPPLAGILIETASWRWVFLLNLPLGVVGLVAVAKLVPTLAPRDPGPFDRKGAGLAIVGVGALLITAELVGIGALPEALAWLLVAWAFAVNAAVIHHMLRQEQPVLDLRLFRQAAFRASMLGGAALRVGLGAMPLLLPLLLQMGLGWSPIKSGLTMLVASIGSLAARGLAPMLLQQIGFRSTISLFAVAAAASSALPAMFRPETSDIFIFASVFLANLARVSHFTVCSALTYAGLPTEQDGRAATLSAMCQALTLSLGVSFGGILLSLASAANGHSLVAADFTLPFMVIGAVGLLALPGYLHLPRDIGDEMRARRPLSAPACSPSAQDG